MPAAAAPSNAPFARSSTSRAASRVYRTPDDVERIIKLNAAHGIKRFFVTDDNFARNRNWEVILDRMIHLRENEGMKFKMVLQVDTLCYRLPGFIEKAARAGCSRVFIGLENIDPDALTAAKKRQNKIWEYRKMLQAWKEAGVITYAGYILGFPDDTPEKIHRNIEIIKNELPLDMIEFFFLTPLPGSEDHKVLQAKGVWMDPDLNKYDLNHRVAHHPDHVRRRAWEKSLSWTAWRQYYTVEHVETILRREAARGGRTKALHATMVHFLGSILIEKVHPLEVGILRRKVRGQRRPGLPIENPADLLSAPTGSDRRRCGGPLGSSLSEVQGHIRSRRQGRDRSRLYRSGPDVGHPGRAARPGHHQNLQGCDPEHPRRARAIDEAGGIRRRPGARRRVTGRPLVVRGLAGFLTGLDGAIDAGSRAAQPSP